MASRVDALFFFLVAVSVFFVGLIFLAILVFAIKYRRRAEDERPEPIEGKLWLEVACEERRDRSVDRGRLLAVEARRV